MFLLNWAPGFRGRRDRLRADPLQGQDCGALSAGGGRLRVTRWQRGHHKSLLRDIELGPPDDRRSGVEGGVADGGRRRQGGDSIEEILA